MVIYFFIHLTGRDTGNTGIQRVVRNLGRSLLGLPGVELVPVRWCHNQRAVVYAEKEFLDVIALHGGPQFPQSEKASQPVRGRSRDQWLLVPEVPHLNSCDDRYPSVQLSNILGYARAQEIKVAALFHDLLPLTHPEADRAPELMRLRFTAYAMALPYVDLLLPISAYTADAMREYLTRIGVPEESLPHATVVEEPAEVLGVERRIPSFDEKAWKDRRVEFVAWGTVCRRKNQGIALEAFNQLCARHPDAGLHFHVAGHVHPEVAGEVGRQVARGRG